MNQIICLSTSPWFPIPTRKQQVMQRLSDAEILYFDPPVSLLAPLKDREAWKKLFAFRKEGVTVNGNITVYALPPVFPFFNRFRWINAWNQKRIARFVRKKVRTHCFVHPVLWCYSPTSCDAVDRIPHKALVYDCVDLHSAYGGQMNPAVVDTMEFDLARKADQVFATAQRLAERLHAVNPTALLIPNGANAERFATAVEDLPCPEDLKDIPHPIFGFVGALQPCLEYSWLEQCAASHPEWSFVLIGNEKPGVNLSALKTLPNTYFLGLKPNELLPAYLHQFTACLNLFGDNALSKDVSPLKFYEYLATGKPIVTTPQPDQVLRYEGLITVAHSPEELSSGCAAALTDDGKSEARMAEGMRCSWNSRVQEMEAVLQGKKILS